LPSIRASAIVSISEIQRLILFSRSQGLMRVAHIRIVDTTFRDAQQCLWATRMSTAMMIPIAEKLDSAGFDVAEVMGAVQFDAAIRYLAENPWERLRLLRQRFTRTPLQALIRSKCVLGFELVPDDLSALWAERLIANGVKRLIVFDGLHDLDNLAAATRRAHELDAYVTGWLTFSDSPVHTDDLYVAKARDFIDRLKIDALMIEDTGGILTPERAATLVPAIKAVIGDLSLGLHSHGLIGLCQRTYLEAIRHGVDNLYTAIPPLADANAPPSIVTTVRNLRASGYSCSVDDALVAEMSAHIERVADLAGKPKGAPRDFDVTFLGHQIPGGVHSNLKSQLEAAGFGDKLPEVLEESARVRADLGWPIQVTPFAQFIGVQATLNVVRGERYAVVPAELKKYALGYYGKLLAPVEPNCLDRIAERGPSSIPLTPPALEPIVPTLRKRYPSADDDEILLHHFFEAGLVDRALKNKPDLDAFMSVETPLAQLIKEASLRPRVKYLSLSKEGLTLEIKQGSA
jgi:oxaloacetate decarboxylase alpha subunit